MLLVFFTTSDSFLILFYSLQNQPGEAFYKKSCYWKFRKTYRKTPVPEPLFNKVAGLRPQATLKKRPWYRCFPLNFKKVLRTPFLQNTSGRPLLLLFYPMSKHVESNRNPRKL